MAWYLLQTRTHTRTLKIINESHINAHFHTMELSTVLIQSYSYGGYTLCSAKKKNWIYTRLFKERKNPSEKESEHKRKYIFVFHFAVHLC